PAAPPARCPCPAGSAWTTTGWPACAPQRPVGWCIRRCARCPAWPPTHATGQPPAVARRSASPRWRAWPRTRLRPGSVTSTGRPSESDPHASAAAGVLLDSRADHGRGLLQAAAVLADELLQAYGYPETGLITRAGQLTPAGFSQRTWGAGAQWAEQHGLLEPL